MLGGVVIRLIVQALPLASAWSQKFLVEDQRGLQSERGLVLPGTLVNVSKRQEGAVNSVHMCRSGAHGPSSTYTFEVNHGPSRFDALCLLFQWLSRVGGVGCWKRQSYSFLPPAQSPRSSLGPGTLP